MKKLILFILCLGMLSSVFAKGSTLTVKPDDFKDVISIYNQTGKEIYVYLCILHDGTPDKEYKSEIITIKPYSNKDIEFDYDSEWHDLVRQLKKFFGTTDYKASSYTFVFHLSEDELSIEKTKVYHNDYNVYIKAKNNADF